MRFQVAAVIAMFVVALAASSGCGDKGPATYAVTGTVTFNGAPLAAGQIAFMPADNRVAGTGGEIVDGKFSLQSAAGEKIVEITATREVGAIDPVMNQRRREQYVPNRYNVEFDAARQRHAEGTEPFRFSTGRQARTGGSAQAAVSPRPLHLAGDVSFATWR